MKTAPLLIAATLACAFAARAADPVVLFDGSGLDAWKMDKEGAWIVKDGELQPAEKGGGGYLWTREKYENFELTVEFKMSKDCNSGVFFRTDPKNPVQGGFEIQVFDSRGKEKIDAHDCGALYDAVAPSVNAAKPPGEWNTMKIVANGPKIRVELNGQTVVEADIDRWTTANQNPDGTKNKFTTALKDLPRDNHIGLQFHGHPVWYRNIRVTPL